MALKTKYEVGKIPLSEYPRPQLRRDSYLTLNGKWNLKKQKTRSGEITFDGEILVPFSPETLNSGIGEGFKLENDERLLYERTFFVAEDFKRDITLLHFGAVDQECKVFINSECVGTHRGGYTPFSFDISKLVTVGENVIRVECTDTTEKSSGARGKQSSNPGKIWYTAQSGIWQSVWLESVPSGYLKGLKITPLESLTEVKIETDCDSAQKITVYDGESEIISSDIFNNEIILSYNFDTWTPESPKLYEFKIEAGDDVVYSYFGVRTFGIGKDKNGIPRLLLNGKPYFYNGVLDQGYYSDGLLTPPSNIAMYDDVKMIKDMGFNMIRKHIKIEPMLWYYYCDTLGITVWQDFVNGGSEYSFMHIGVLPFLGFHHKDSDYKYFAREDKAGREEFIDSVHETVKALYNCPSISAWVPFNEGWGQFDSFEITKLLRSLDDTRIIDSVSGWHDQGKGKTTLRSLHIYYTKLKVPKDTRPVVLSEFGGYSLKTSGHVYNEEKEFGYKVFTNTEKFVNGIENLFINKVKPLIKKGLCAAVYTQLSDVEEEINGLVTYDRCVIKAPIYNIRRLNEQIMDEASEVF
jgi:beta-galactosidase/beta-glucuronidase